MDLLAATSASGSRRPQATHEAGGKASAAGHTAAGDGGLDADCEEELVRARGELENLMDRVYGTGSGGKNATAAAEEGEDGGTSLWAGTCEQEVREAVQDTKESYMRSALHADALALRGTLAKFNATLAADWAAELAAQPQRGILMLAGPRSGHVYTINAFVTLWVIRRHFKSKLPVVIMYWGDEEAEDPAIQELFWAELGAPAVEFVDASRLPWPAHHRALFLEGQSYSKRGWAIKLAASYFTPFQEVLYLDTDSTPLVPPEALFELPQYRRSGNLFWPCIIPDRAQIFDDLIEMGLIDAAVAPPDMMQTESGQWLLDKRRHREALEYLLFLGTRSDYAFLKAYGDKEMYLAAFALAGAADDFNLVPGYLGLAWGPSVVEKWNKTSGAARRLRGFVQFSPVDGGPAFLHRAGAGDAKYKLEVPEGRPLDVISGPVPQKWARPRFNARYRVPWPDAEFQAVDPAACPFSLDEGFGAAAARCGGEFTGEEGQRVPVFGVEGSAMAAAQEAAEEGWRRVMAAREKNPKMLPMSLMGALSRLATRA